MRYMLLIYADENGAGASIPDAPAGAAVGEAAGGGISPAWMEYTGWLLERGIHVGGERLASSGSATTVRVRDNDRLITDGPFAETKEVLGGYYIIECEDLDQALEAAARCPGALTGSVEVRPLLQLPGMTGPTGATVDATAGRR